MPAEDEELFKFLDNFSKGSTGPSRDLLFLDRKSDKPTLTARRGKPGGGPTFISRPEKIPFGGFVKVPRFTEKQLEENVEAVRREREEETGTLFKIGEFATEALPAISAIAADPRIPVPGGIPTRLAIRGAGMAGLSFLGAKGQQTIRGAAGGTETGGPLGPVRPTEEIVGEDLAMNALFLGAGKLAGGLIKHGRTVKNFTREIEKNPSFFADKFNAATKGVLQEERLIPAPRALSEGIAGPPLPVRTKGEVTKAIADDGTRFFRELKAERKAAFEDFKARTALPENTIKYNVLKNPPKGTKADFFSRLADPIGAKPPTGSKIIVKTIQTPITTSKLQPQLQQLKTRLAELRDAGLDPAIAAKFTRAETAVKALTTPLETIDGPRFIHPFKPVDDLRKLLQDGKFGRAVTEAEGVELGLARNIEASIQDSLKNAADESLLPLRQKAFALEVQFKNTFPTKLQNALQEIIQRGGKEVPGLQEIVDRAFNSEKGTRQLVAALKGDKTLAKEFFLTDLVNKNTAGTGGMNFNTFLDQVRLSRSNKGGGGLLTSKEFNAMENLIVNAQNLLPEGTVGNRLVSMQDGRIGIIGTFTGMRSALGGHLTQAVASFGAGAGAKILFALSPHSLVKRIMLDPKRAPQLAELIRTGSINNRKSRALALGVIGAKGLVGTLKVQTEKDGPFETVAGDVTLGDNSNSPVPPIR